MKDKWMKNVLSYFQSADAGNCPECGATVSVEKHETPYRDAYIFRCTECRAGAHFDGTCKRGET